MGHQTVRARRLAIAARAARAALAVLAMVAICDTGAVDRPSEPQVGAALRKPLSCEYIESGDKKYCIVPRYYARYRNATPLNRADEEVGRAGGYVIFSRAAGVEDAGAGMATHAVIQREDTGRLAVVTGRLIVRFTADRFPAAMEVVSDYKLVVRQNIVHLTTLIGAPESPDAIFDTLRALRRDTRIADARLELSENVPKLR